VDRHAGLVDAIDPFEALLQGPGQLGAVAIGRDVKPDFGLGATVLDCECVDGAGRCQVPTQHRVGVAADSFLRRGEESVAHRCVLEAAGTSRCGAAL